MQCLVNVFRLEVWIGGEDLIAGLAGSEQPKQPRYWKSEPPDARLSGANTWIDCNSHEPH
jgi:hypothetical protein